MIAFIGRLALLLVCLAVFLPAKHADAVSTRDREDIARIEGYLKGLRTLRSEFTQISADNTESRGIVYIERPNRLRLDYQKPPNIQVFVNGNWLVHVDTNLETVSHIPVSATPARYLLRNSFDFGKDVTVQRVIREPGRISIKLSATDDPDEGSFTLAFLTDPFMLLSWTIVDARGFWTAVILSAPEFNVPIPRQIFVFDSSKYTPEVETP